MKIAVTVARVLLGLIFLIFGLNGFLHFIPQQMPTGVAGQFLGALFVSHYLVAVFLVQLVGGILLLANQYVPLALTLLGAVLANILLFHICMAPAGLPLALVTTLLWLLAFADVRKAFTGIFVRKVERA